MDEPAGRHSSWAAALAVVLAIGGSAVGVLIYQHFQNRPRPVTDNAGFDLAQTTDAPRPVRAANGTAPGSSLGMITVGQMGSRTQARVYSIEETFAQLCRATEDQVRALSEKYTRQYPVFQEYGKEWMSYPDLKKLNDDYMRFHDPIAFLNGASQSKNFGHMLKKYGGNPAMQAYVKQGMKEAPGDVTDAALKYMEKDNVAKGLVTSVMQSVGIPAVMLTGLGSQPSAPPKLTQQQVMDSVMKANPDMQKLMNTPEAQNALSTPEAQKRLKSGQ